MDCSIGASPPPPMPWKMRATISMGRLVDSPQASDDSVNSATENM